ncbi:DeoR family fructose operon transcriptional repressor [Microbacteriaceae bacterium SG_E_30_P1]|uniref:Lactose phosphotransferase system repressor n=1 Tax=Antiquaquibacter oligotrophicus TaxID=2880260 RepID=A0ABT6KRE9_9MICO|nr:DeoR/GlpR family DNA-binding transcription regulator [Antiquaquibacter oligotrophicus]MDH6181772.1 DeoR family fructose operon transcriptional repressor [Antiquaquibacter oligotrophicus]UDF12547.1 DeoR/GlpR family DNA-binding transcription regulator [Antiquaquibacter oligotrophicus]
MYAPERHQKILEQAHAQGRVDVRELAELLAVTPETIRRDLTSLERRGLVRRAHGGAIPVERAALMSPVSDREGLHASEKLAIATLALDELPENGSIIIDAGTTAIRFAELLPADRPLTVVTHSLAVASTVAPRPNIELYLLGGAVRTTSLASVGTWTHQLLGMVNVDVAFISVNGLTPERGLTTTNMAEAAVKTALIKAARRTVVLADHTKFGREEFGRIAPLAAVDTVITDAGVNADLVQDIEAAGTQVLWPGRPKAF